REMTKFAITSRGCDVSGKCSATRERPSAASTQPTRPRVRHGSDHKTTAALVSQHIGWLLPATVRVTLRDVQCPRCNGYGRAHMAFDSRNVSGIFAKLTPTRVKISCCAHRRHTRALGCQFLYFRLACYRAGRRTLPTASPF